MSLFHRLVVAPIAVLVLAGAARAQSFVIGFDGPAVLSGPEGSVVEATYFATLTPLDGKAAQAWDIIVSATNATLTGISLEGTTADGIINHQPCFGLPECNFVTNQLGNGMVCSAVLPSLNSSPTLPPSGTSTIARITVQVVVPSCGGKASLQYCDCGGCFLGVASTNVVTAANASHTIANGLLAQEPLAIAIESTSGCDPKVLLADLIGDVKALDAPKGVEVALDAVLSAALHVLQDSSPRDDKAAVPILNAFMKLAGALSGKGLSPADADALTVAAQEIIAVLTTG